MKIEEIKQYEEEAEKIVKEEIKKQREKIGFREKVNYRWRKEGKIGEQDYLSEIDVLIDNRLESIDTYLIIFQGKPFYENFKNLREDIRITFSEWLDEYKKGVASY